MGRPFKSLNRVMARRYGIGVLGLTALVSGVLTSTPTSAQEDASQPGRLAEQFNQAFYENDKPFWQNRSPLRQIDFLLGPGIIFRNSFTENEIMRDGRAIHNLYVDALNQQVASDPVIRTPDLPNPYNTSIFSQPAFSGGARPLGTQLNFGIPMIP